MNAKKPTPPPKLPGPPKHVPTGRTVMAGQHYIILSLAVLFIAFGLWPRDKDSGLSEASKLGPEVPCEIDCRDYLTTCIEGIPNPDTLDSCVAACRVAKPRRFYACFHRPGSWCPALLPCLEDAK